MGKRQADKSHNYLAHEKSCLSGRKSMGDKRCHSFTFVIMSKYIFSAYPNTNYDLLNVGVNMQQRKDDEKTFYEDQQSTQKCRLSKEVDEEYKKKS